MGQDFDVNKLTGEDAKAIVRSIATGFQATIQRQQASSEKLISTLTLDLSVERTRATAMKVSFPFISVRVEEATDLNSSCRIIPVSIDTYQDDTLMKLNDSLEFDNGISNVFITNTAQAGKKMVLKFYTQARVRSGSLVLDQNSTPSTFSAGEATSQNDGYTFLLGTEFFSVPATAGTVESMRQITSANDMTFNTGVVTVNSFPQPKQFKVPAGYTAEVIGSELKIATAYAQVMTFVLCAVKDGSTYAAANNLVFDNSVVCSSTHNGSYAQSNTPIKMAVSNVNGYLGQNPGNQVTPNRMKNIFLENEIIFPIIYNPGNNIATTGRGLVMWIVRLTKNVGA